MNILDTIQSPEDLKNLSVAEMKTLAEELRSFIVSAVSHTGGHLAPNLGVVELTLALHHVFDTPRDKIVWDVGHQAYVHKILTGRKDRFLTLRQYGGISGFPKITESEYDAFGVGHSSTAISAATGMAYARDLLGEHYSVVAVVGDGALSGGEAFEGLNNAGGSRKDLVVILNDNRMSISPNVGALSRYLTQIITAPFYNKLKGEIWDLTGKLPRGRDRIRETVHRIEAGVKSILVPGLLFERLGFRYFGPIDGHDLDWLIRTLSQIKKMHGPILVHVVSTKGKGYKYAEQDAIKFHGLGSFCPDTGEPHPRSTPSYTEVFGRTLVELAEKDEKIIAITAAMADGTGLVPMQERFPNRFFDVGIAEQHAVTFSAAMGLQGFKPVVAIYSTFLQRALDQVIHDVALQNISVIFIVDRAGLVGEDGPTHHGSFDVSYLRMVPNLVFMTPKDENELRDMLWTAVQYGQGPVAIRFPRGESLGLKPREMRLLPIGKGEILRTGRDMAILAIGDRVVRALKLAERLKTHGIDCRVLNGRFIKPLDRKLILKTASEVPILVTLENNTVIGGFGSSVAELLAESGMRVVFRRFGLPDEFVPHGKICDLERHVHLDEEHIFKALLKLGESRSHRKVTRKKEA